MVKHYNNLKDKNPTTDFPTLSDCLGLSLDETIVRCSKTSGRQSYSCRLTAFCASKCLAVNLHLIFPPVYGLASPYSKFPDYFEHASPRSNKPRSVTIVWTTAADIVQPNGSHYKFNHFCPVFMVGDKWCHVPESHLSKVNKLKDHVFHPFENTNHPRSFIELERQPLNNLPHVPNDRNGSDDFQGIFNSLTNDTQFKLY